MAAAIPDPRDPDAITHAQATMLRQRIFSLALGYEDLNDQQTLRSDPLLQAASGRSPDPAAPLASAPTLCRLENRIHRATLMKLSQLLVAQFIASQQAPGVPPSELILDFDATDDPVHGRQEGRFFHGYYDRYCFLPLYVFCGDELLVSYLRPANIDAARHPRGRLGDPEPAGAAVAARVAERAHPLPGRQRILSLANDALVRSS